MKWTKRIFVMVLMTSWLAGGALAQNAIDQTAAEDKALAASGVAREQALLFPTEKETEQGETVYDVEFVCGGLEYEYWIAASDGMLLRQSWEPTSERTLELAAFQQTDGALIGDAVAFVSALSHAALTAQEAKLIETKLDLDGCLCLYELSFYTETAEYEYEIDAISGAIYAVTMEIFREENAQRLGSAALNAAREASVSQAIARAAALSEAGLTEAEVTFTKTKLDREDGVWVYEVEFVTAEAEYEYEIDASSGLVREGKAERRSLAQSVENAAAFIGVDRAKSIAVGRAGLSEDKEIFVKAKLEKDDGVRIYEIEFRFGDTEYEYDIGAASGSILEYDRECDEQDRKEKHDDDDRDEDRDDDDDDDDD